MKLWDDGTHGNLNMSLISGSFNQKVALYDWFAFIPAEADTSWDTVL